MTDSSTSADEPTPETTKVVLCLADTDEQVEFDVDSVLANAIFGHNATPVLRVADGGDDPEVHGDSFAAARQRVLNAIQELQAAHAAHAIMVRPEQPMALARQIAEQQCILVFNMLGQAGLMEARAAEMQQKMQGMAEERSIHLPGGETKVVPSADA